jgi:hypothetical protein
MIYFALNDFVLPAFMLILFLSVLLGFLDDTVGVPFILQAALHIVFFVYLIINLGLTQYFTPYQLFVGVLFCLTFLIIVSRHDQMNGLLASSALVFFLSLIFTYPPVQNLDSSNPIIFIILTFFSFGWYNFKQKAELFWGTSGRNGIAYLMLFFGLQLIIGKYFLQATRSNDVAQSFQLKPQYLLFFLVISLDFVQSVFRKYTSKAKQGQLPLFFVNLLNKNYPFWTIILIYCALQGLINFALIAY